MLTSKDSTMLRYVAFRILIIKAALLLRGRDDIALYSGVPR